MKFFLQSEFLTHPIDSRRKISEYEFCNKIKGIVTTQGGTSNRPLVILEGPLLL